MQKLYQHQFKAMGGPCSFHLYCDNEKKFEQVLAIAIAHVTRLESKYSRYKQDSLLSKINATAGMAAGIKLDEESFALLQYADSAYQISAGLFDVTSGVMRNAWDFKSGEVPSEQSILQYKKYIGWQDVVLEQNNFFLPRKGMEIDLGGIVKEFAVDSLIKVLKANGVISGLVDLAGDIGVIGPPPNEKSWKIGIKDPFNTEQAIAEIPLTSGGLASSGDYERCLVINGKKYSHLLNPQTGWPIEGFAAISVWAEQCIVAGTVATTALLHQQQAVEFLKAINLPFVAVSQQGEVFTS